MKTGAVRFAEHGGEPCLETDGWTPWLYHAPDVEIERYYDAANSVMSRLERMPLAVRARLDQIAVRCPASGCLLAKVYWVPRRPTSKDLEEHSRMIASGQPIRSGPCRPGEWLYVGRTAAGTEVYDIMFYGFSWTPSDRARGCTCCRPVYWRAGCRHGTATLDRHWLHDLFGLAHRDLAYSKSEEETISALPEHLRPFWGKRVFHPSPDSWHLKKVRQRSIISGN